MSLAGRGAIAIWNGIRPEGRREFFGWHNREHMLERVSIPGFLRGRRYIAIDAAPEFFTLYEVAMPEVMTGPDYLARLSAPTEWTRRAVAYFTDTARSLTRVAVSAGLGQGGVLATLRFEPSGQDLEGAVAAAAEAALSAHPEILSIHLGLTDVAASSVDTAEKKVRGAGTEVPGAVLLIEGTDAGVVGQLAGGPFGDDALAAWGVSGRVMRGLYRLEVAIAKDDIAVGA